MIPNSVKSKNNEKVDEKKSGIRNRKKGESSPVPMKEQTDKIIKTITKKEKKSKTAVSSHKIEYEFGGPVGALGVIFGLPLVIFALYFLCNKDVCVENPMNFNWTQFLNER